MNRIIHNGLFLLISSVIMFVVLFITYQADTIRLQGEQIKKTEHLLDVEEKLNIEIEVREQVETENENIKKENETLTQMLFNRARIYELVVLNASSRSDYLSRSDRQLSATTMPLTIPSGFTAKILGHAFDMVAPGMKGTEEYFVLAEELYGINSLVLAAICHLESEGGSSKIAQEKNNLAGLGAHDGTAYKSAIGFNSRADSIFFLAELLATKYAPGGKYYSGSFTIEGIHKNYATDPMWAIKVGKIMSKLVQAGIENPKEIIITTGLSF